MTLSDITTRINFLTGTTVNEYSAASRLVSLNIWYQKVHSWILQSCVGWIYDDNNQDDMPSLTNDTVANQQSYSGLAAERIVKIRRVEITYDGTHWVKATPLELSQDNHATDATTLLADFSTEVPRYRIAQDSIYLYPTPTKAVTGGIKIFVDRNPVAITAANVTTGTLEPGFDLNFHDILSMGVSYDYNSVKKNDKSLMQDILMMKQDLMNQYSTKIVERKIGITPIIEDYT